MYGMTPTVSQPYAISPTITIAPPMEAGNGCCMPNVGASGPKKSMFSSCYNEDGSMGYPFCAFVALMIMHIEHLLTLRKEMEEIVRKKHAKKKKKDDKASENSATPTATDTATRTPTDN
ncbi:hypothetical protein Ciccas_005469 [Cichlidogyrus casuarinus]|uniref:Uncharacterized protein n=1 Tax=Cichlidogyrus casuarinus TaxID=1844966 RepID=A0ABD2Q8M0_9PLAT